jgi:phospholipid/cholesterol/gamma-HCH transport system ATP-binding protein
MENAAPNPAAPPVAPIEMVGVAAAHEHAPTLAAIEDVNWRVGTGEFWAVGGFQGAGKSVLLGAAAGINRPLRGQLKLFESDIAELEATEAFARLLRIGLVFEGDGRVFASMTVAENIALPLLYHERDNEEEIADATRAMLDLMELSELADTPIVQLPRHLRHRTALARALALRPEVLLVDNPLGRQTAREAGWWLRMLHQLAEGHPWFDKRPLTLAVTADDLRPWRECARQFAVLDQRRLRVIGGRAELDACAEDCVRELLVA